jgi:CheY-like chemotaxis protein
MHCRILVVDDDTAVREPLVAILTRAGHTVMEAPNGDAVLQLLEDGDRFPDLILLDLRMPHHNGLALLETLREHPEWCRIPVVITSGAPDAPERATQFNLFCLPKPFTGEALLNIVECYCADPSDGRA